MVAVHQCKREQRCCVFAGLLFSFVCGCGDGALLRSSSSRNGDLIPNPADPIAVGASNDQLPSLSDPAGPDLNPPPTGDNVGEVSEAPVVNSEPPDQTQPDPDPPDDPHPPLPGDHTESVISSCDSPVEYDVTPANIKSYQSRAKNECVVLNMAAGSYGRLTPKDLGHITYRCTKPHSCLVNRYIPSRVKTLIIEGIKFGASNEDYGISAYYVDQLKVTNSIFDGEYTHDISTKNIVGYMEVFNNRFVKCNRHCLELGQNGNIASRPSTCGTAVVKNNTFDSPLINAITQRANQKLIVEENHFTNVKGWVVTSWPYWRKYPFGAASDDGTLYIPEGPLRTIIRNNTFTGTAKFKFEGRGVTDDTVLIQNNQGGYSCQLVPMASGTAAATADEETTSPPKLDPSSDPC